MEILAGKLPEARGRGAQWATAVQWSLRHDFARANNLLMPLFDHAISYRYPAGATPLEGPVKLRDYPEKAGWLGDPATWEGDLPQVTPFRDFQGDPSRACWLPDGYMAAVWQSFVVREPRLRIVRPAGMGDGAPFEALRSDDPLRVEVRLEGDLDPARIELLDGYRRIGELSGSPPRCELKGIAPGLHALIASAVTRDGRRFHSHPNTVLITAPEPPGGSGDGAEKPEPRGL
jgi:hypothetical protein